MPGVRRGVGREASGEAPQGRDGYGNHRGGCFGVPALRREAISGRDGQALREDQGQAQARRDTGHDAGGKLLRGTWRLRAPPSAGGLKPLESHQKYLDVEYDASGLDEAVPALRYLNSFENYWETRARKDMAWEATERIYEEGPIGGPVEQSKVGRSHRRRLVCRRAGFPKNRRIADAGSKPLRVRPSDHTFSNNLTHAEPLIACVRSRTL